MIRNAKCTEAAIRASLSESGVIGLSVVWQTRTDAQTSTWFAEGVIKLSPIVITFMTYIIKWIYCRNELDVTGVSSILLDTSV